MQNGGGCRLENRDISSGLTYLHEVWYEDAEWVC